MATTRDWQAMGVGEGVGLDTFLTVTIPVEVSYDWSEVGLAWAGLGWPLCGQHILYPLFYANKIAKIDSDLKGEREMGGLFFFETK